MLLDVDWQHNFQSFYETIRVKIACKDHNKIPKERVFGIQGKLYRILVEVEPSGDEDEGTGHELPSTGTLVTGETEKRNNKSSGDAASHKSSKDSSENGSNTSSGIGNPPRNISQSLCNGAMEPPTPTSLLKTKISLQHAKESTLGLLLDKHGDLDDGFRLPMEMENWNEDGINTEGEWDELEEEALIQLPALTGKEGDVVKQQQYETELPPIQTQGASKTKHWGPVQAPRMSARIVGDTRTILQKAQQFKESQDKEIPKDCGKKHTPISLFNNPSFLSVAEKIDVDVEIDVEVDENAANVEVNATVVASNVNAISDTLISGRTVGSKTDFTTPTRHNIGSTPEISSSELWYLVCKNKRGKHPRTRLLP